MNAKTQNTPGPWSYNRDEGGCHGHVITIADFEIAEAFSEYLGEEQGSANARLIAAAPDLLGFSLEIAHVVRSSGANLCSPATQAERSAFISGIVDAWNKGGYDAIAKATGAAL